MSTLDSHLESTLRDHRERLGLSQQALGDAVGVSRQAINQIEGGKQVPSTSLSLRLAHALGCSVEDLFRIRHADGLRVRMVPTAATGGSAGGGSVRVAMGEVDGEWVAHRLAPDPSVTADGILTSASGGSGIATALVDPERIRRNVIVTGCAPILDALAQRVGDRFRDAHATWLPVGSQRSLALLEAGLVHVAGLHYSVAEGDEGDVLETIRARFPSRRMLVVNLTRWRQGFVLPKGNPMGISEAGDLVGRPIRFAMRERGAAARELVAGLLESGGVADLVLEGPVASGHAEVAQLVRVGAADVGVAIESVALAADLDFVPLREERFDLILPAATAADGPARRLIEALDDTVFRAELRYLPGYDAAITGEVTTLEAA